MASHSGPFRFLVKLMTTAEKDRAQKLLFRHGNKCPITKSLLKNIFNAGLSRAFRKIPMAEEVPLQAAQQLVVNPQPSDPVYPYGEVTYFASSSNQPGPSGVEQALPKKGKRRHVLEPKDDIKNRKFSQTVISDKNIITWAQFKSQLPKQMHSKKWFNTFKKLNSTAVAKVTWNKYLSAVNKLAIYCKTFKLSLHWPLTDKIIHGFVLWALSGEGLHPDTVKAYISAYSCLQRLHGFQGISVVHSPFIKRLLKGAKNIRFS
jgi:hypothetical protein